MSLWPGLIWSGASQGWAGLGWSEGDALCSDRGRTVTGKLEQRARSGVSGPMRAQYSGHVTCPDQSERSIQARAAEISTPGPWVRGCGQQLRIHFHHKTATTFPDLPASWLCLWSRRVMTLCHDDIFRHHDIMTETDIRNQDGGDVRMSGAMSINYNYVNADRR